jgi:hypothetical protein
MEMKPLPVSWRFFLFTFQYNDLVSIRSFKEAQDRFFSRCSHLIIQTNSSTHRETLELSRSFS